MNLPGERLQTRRVVNCRRLCQGFQHRCRVRFATGEAIRVGGVKKNRLTAESLTSTWPPSDACTMMLSPCVLCLRESKSKFATRDKDTDLDDLACKTHMASYVLAHARRVDTGDATFHGGGKERPTVLMRRLPWTKQRVEWRVYACMLKCPVM
jgi:hypothetical protein